MAQAALAVAIGAQVAGTALKVQGAREQAKAAADAARFNRTVALQEQEFALEAGFAEEARRRRRKRRELASQRTGIGASGFTASGSKLDVLARNAAELEVDALNARLEGQLRARSAGIEAELLRVRRKNIKRQGRQAVAAELISGVGKLAQTGARLGGGSAPTP